MKMDISDVIGRGYPQKVTLDSNIVTVTGELISKGTEINVLLCDQLLICTDSRNYGNIDFSENRIQKTIYLNPGSQEQFLDVHCTGKIYKTVDQLCQDKPRYFSSVNNFFVMDKDEQTVRINDGDEFELTNVQTIDTFIDKESRKHQSYTNVETKTTNIAHCCCKHSGIGVHILPSTRSSFKSLSDPNPYKPSEIRGRFTLPRQVQLYDGEMYRSASRNFGFEQISIDSMTKTVFLLFTLDYEVSGKSHAIQTKDNVKCCQLPNPSFVKLRRRIENSQIGEVLDPAFVFKYEQFGRTIFSVLGKSNMVPTSRLCSGRQNYLAMQSAGDAFSPNPSCDSGFAETEQDQHFSRQQPLTASIVYQSKEDDDKIETDEEDYLVPVVFEEVCSSHDSGDYVAISLNSEKPPPIPERLYHKNDGILERITTEPKELQSDTDTTTIHMSDTDVIQNQTATDTETDVIQNQTSDIETDVIQNKAATDTETNVIQNQTATDTETDVIQNQTSDTETDFIPNQAATNTETYVIRNQTTDTETNVIQNQTKVTETHKDTGDKSEIKHNDCVKTGQHLLTLSCGQLADLLKTCKLDRFADMCLEETIDGELFIDLNEDILKDEPFRLNKLEILKVNKMKGGWRPNK